VIVLSTPVRPLPSAMSLSSVPSMTALGRGGPSVYCFKNCDTVAPFCCEHAHTSARHVSASACGVVQLAQAAAIMYSEVLVL
jgi:hypothetical protein